MKVDDKLITNQILYILSSSQLLILYSLLFYVLYNLNIYSIILLFILLSKTVILHPLKKILRASKIGKRPKKAFNCNQYNCGGIPTSGGFPSGHMMTLGLLIGILLSYRDIGKSISTNIIIVYLIITISTAFGRYLTNCHTLFQIISGYLIGIIIGYTCYIIGGFIEKYSDIYRQHRHRFYSDLNGIFDIISIAEDDLKETHKEEQ